MISTIDGLRSRLAEARAAAPDGARVALISTIGALHDGHIDLVHRAREVADLVVVSIFVNPLRFATVAEYEAYPRTLDEDERLEAILPVVAEYHLPVIGICNDESGISFDPLVRLGVARKIVERHGGTLTLAAADGPGACFVIELPIA